MTPDARDQLAFADKLGGEIDKRHENVESAAANLDGMAPLSRILSAIRNRKGPNDAILGDDIRVLDDAPLARSCASP